MNDRHLSVEELGFWQRIEYYPRHPQPMLEYAAWLEQQGRPEAAGWRVLAELGHWPETVWSAVPGHVGMKQFRWLPAESAAAAPHALPGWLQQHCRPAYSRPSAALADAASGYAQALRTEHR